MFTLSKWICLFNRSILHKFLALNLILILSSLVSPVKAQDTNNCQFLYPNNTWSPSLYAEFQTCANNMWIEVMRWGMTSGFGVWGEYAVLVNSERIVWTAIYNPNFSIESYNWEEWGQLTIYFDQFTNLFFDYSEEYNAYYEINTGLVFYFPEYTTYLFYLPQYKAMGVYNSSTNQYGIIDPSMYIAAEETSEDVPSYLYGIPLDSEMENLFDDADNLIYDAYDVLENSNLSESEYEVFEDQAFYDLWGEWKDEFDTYESMDIEELETEQLSSKSCSELEGDIQMYEEGFDAIGTDYPTSEEEIEEGGGSINIRDYAFRLLQEYIDRCE